MVVRFYLSCPDAGRHNVAGSRNGVQSDQESSVGCAQDKAVVKVTVVTWCKAAIAVLID